MGAWILYSLRSCQRRVADSMIKYPSSGLLKARMHVETWKKNIIEGGEVTLEMTKDPFPPELTNKFAKLARDFAVRVP